jgi:hypothetical protein
MVDPSAALSLTGNGTLWSCPTGRRTVRLEVAQTTGGAFPSASSSLLAGAVGRNLFEEVSAEDTGVGADADAGVVVADNENGSVDASVAVNDSYNETDPVSMGVVGNGLMMATLSSLMSSDIKLGGDVLPLPLPHLTLSPRTKDAMALVASVLVEEILEQAVGRQNELGSASMVEL